ncbi:HAMP domain-containing histidine kinase [Acidiferrimicrobium sp. IK]|uniref:sensor histidine kinase n=1 Tax=Acidiferrimicrobium sp. IK TaxID=2871700 RepID=UPI0021CB47F1|nr:HAMP domain-containing sensor histidine kinase [Acidiferrimicrobium sp. IK]MCU4183235.1 HAMP domain-containing histidine kinase [Acidiferrimicrobium sp. IK]
MTNHRIEHHDGASRADHLGEADDLLALSAHELRGPVAAIVGFAETVRDRRGRLSEQQLDDALDTIVRQAHRLDGLLQDILLLAAGRAGLLQLRPVTLSLRDALLEVVADDGVDPASVTVVCDPDVQVFVDPRRLHQMVTNYLTNARIHGSAPYTVEVSVGAGRVRVAVGDAGRGVAESHRSRLFERFERAGADPSVAGSGLGLAVVRTLAEASGGSASLDPGPPHRFVLQLPVVPAPAR